MTAQQIAPDIYLVQVPIPVPLKFVNCYLFKGANGWSIVDGGFHDDAAEATWQQAFTDLGIGSEDVTTILVTHYHPDHYGAAGWLQHWTGAPVYLLDKEVSQVELFWRSEHLPSDLERFFSGHGMSAEIAEEIKLHHQRQIKRVLPEPEITTLSEGEQILLGDRLFQVLWCPGHSDGLATFWCEADGILLANDHVLPKITPNISLWPGGRPDPLADYLDSLGKVENLPAKLVLPGHRQPLTDLKGRVAEIRAHHDRRLKEMLGMVGDGATGWEVSTRFFNMEGFSHHQLRFAMGETLAHLEYLRRAGKLQFDGTRYRLQD